MKILTIGAGFVGSTHSAVLASHGHDVLAYDLDKAKVADLDSRIPERIDARIYEPGLAALIKTHPSTLRFTADFSDVAKVVGETDVIFMCLPTPAEELERPIEQRFLFKAAKSLSDILSQRNAAEQQKYVLIVNKSTVPIGTAAQLDQKLKEWGVKNYGVASNPEFLVEGKAVSGSQKPDRVVIGVNSAHDERLMREVYRNIDQFRILGVKPADAEAVKLVANFELFSTVVRSYLVAGRLCETVPGLTFENVIRCVTSDARIPKWGHYLAAYSGGSCFEKDAKNLLDTLHRAGADGHTLNFIKGIIDGNDFQLENFYRRASEDRFSFEGKTVALLGTAFKQDTNDVRMSPALTLTDWMLRDGVRQIRAYDPQAGQNYKNQYARDSVVLCASAKQALDGTDAAIICTDWPQFKFLAQEFDSVKKPFLLMDGRRMLTEQYSALAEKGISVVAVGSRYMPRESPQLPHGSQLDFE